MYLLRLALSVRLMESLIEFDITPNRGDVLSLKGLEREFCAYQVKKSKNRLETFALKLNKDNQDHQSN